ncbi:MAG: hypothetical protein LBT47_12740 [Deltaproteobacteria bacterium]|jgi:hypothetical protein|nr:hypothetical protein [Deltaproteobacteria bacterium]
MKKIMALVLGVLLVAMAVPALADTSVDFNGVYRLQHLNTNNIDRAWRSRDIDRGSLFRHRFQVGVTFHATDEIDVDWVIRAPHWANWGGEGATSIVSRAYYATIKQPWGTIQVGRLADGAPGTVGGLSTLGHGPSWGGRGDLYAGGSIFDFNDTVDGITYNHEFGNGFGLAAYYFKFVTDTSEKDADVDRFGIEPRYTWDGGGATLGFIYHRDKTPFYGGAWFTPTYSWTSDNLSLFQGAFSELANHLRAEGYVRGAIDFYGPDSDYTFIINPAFAQTWGAFSIGFEGAFAWAKTRYLVDASVEDAAGNPIELSSSFDVDKKGFGLYFDAGYNYGAGDITFLAWFTSGTDWDDDDEFNDAIGLGDFAPFLVAFGSTSFGSTFGGYGLNQQALLTRTRGDDDLTGEMTGGSNQWGIGLLGNHSLTDDIALNWGIGYFALVQPYGWDLDEFEGPDPAKDYRNRKKDLGWEIDLGFTFNLLDNLSFETQFGYFFNGGAFDTLHHNDAEGYHFKDAKDSYAWTNVLNISF